MFNFLKLFMPKQDVPPKGRFPLSAILDEPDVRDIPFTAVHAPIPAQTLPRRYNLQTKVKAPYQGNLGVCVAATLAYVMSVYQEMESGVVGPFLMRDLYAKTRTYLGMANGDSLAGQGLPQREAAKVLTTTGMCRDYLEENDDHIKLPHSVYVNTFEETDGMKHDANVFRPGGFAFPSINVEDLKQALFKVKVLPITIAIDWDKISFATGWFRKPVSIDGYHEVALTGYDDDGGYFTFANWWGEGDGYGRGYIDYDDVPYVIRDAVAFTDISNDLVERAKRTQYIFLNDLQEGMLNSGVRALQKRLTEYGLYDYFITGFFGPLTKASTMKYQKLNGIEQLGRVGPLTKAELNEDEGVNVSKSKIDMWCEAIATMENANPANNNPGNLRYVGQARAIGKTPQGFCKFATYADGYLTLREMLVRCATLPDVAPYRADMTLLEFYQVYAPSTDGNNPANYAKFVASRLGVTPETVISTFV